MIRLYSPLASDLDVFGLVTRSCIPEKGLFRVVDKNDNILIVYTDPVSLLYMALFCFEANRFQL